MSDGPWWATVLQWTVWALLMSLVMGWLGRSRMKARPAAESRKLRHPTSTLITGVVGCGFFVALAIVSAVSFDTPGRWWIALAFLGFALLSAPLLLDYFIARHEVSDEGLSFCKLSGGRKFMRWSEVRTVRYATMMKWFRLEGEGGDVARLSVMMMGLPEFARMLLERVPASAIEPPTLAVLQATAAGQPPSVWQ